MNLKANYVSPIYTVVFGYVPYLVVLLFVVGVLYRFIGWVVSRKLTGLYSVAVMPYRDNYAKVTGEVLKRILTFYTLSTNDRLLFTGSFLFHWGIWIVLIGHLGVILPESTLAALGITPALHRLIAYVVGGVAGTIALIGLIILIIRRIVGYEVRIYSFRVRVRVSSISYLDDYFALSILLLLLIFGLLQTLWLHPDFEVTVAPWIWSLVSLHPDVSYIAAAPVITQVHVLLAMLFIAYFPWGKMMHPFSFLIMPTITRPALKITYRP